jgi:hypothetical protein
VLLTVLVDAIGRCVCVCGGGDKWLILASMSVYIQMIYTYIYVMVTGCKV